MVLNKYICFKYPRITKNLYFVYVFDLLKFLSMYDYLCTVKTNENEQEIYINTFL